MTTVACNRELMASDSKFTEEGIEFCTPKIWRIGKSLWGECGETRGCGKFFRWLRAGMPDSSRPTFDGDLDDFCVIELNKQGIFYWDRHLFPVEVSQPHFAIGSGSALALYCMNEHSMTPEQSVAESIKYDEASGGPVVVERLVPSKRGGEDE